LLADYGSNVGSYREEYNIIAINRGWKKCLGVKCLLGKGKYTIFVQLALECKICTVGIKV
jgi:hypothetical protein